MSESPSPAAAPAALLAGPAPSTLSVQRIDFAATPLAKDYAGSYAVVLDDVLSAPECAALVAAAERAGGGWEPARVHGGHGDAGLLVTDYRKGDRIIWDEAEVVARLWARVRDRVPELAELHDWEAVLGKYMKKERMQATRLNERMRFLRYAPGDFFQSSFATFAWVT